MTLTLTICSGDSAGRRFEVTKGIEFRVGRDAPCEVRLPSDSSLSNPHFTILIDDTKILLRDRGSKFGTFHNDDRITESELRDGDRIRAGKTEFTVTVKSATAIVPAPAPSAPPHRTPVVLPPREDEVGTVRDLVAFFQTLPNLYAIMDAGRELSIPQRLAESGAEFESLYDVQDMPEKFAIAHQGPWLVRLTPDSPLLESLLVEGWGNSWGVYLSSSQPFQDIRHHLRRYVTVLLPDQRPVLFRFYDPRVLRVYLPTCKPDELKNFFGPVHNYFCEDLDPTELLLFDAARRDPARLAVDLPANVPA